ncbi:hypothetical protein PVAP13_1NG451619 [Panicum virgatum]|uniref:Uncharacterized protein n=1 Tax=Panicum virgatum TaxID=38727 RepID=A0A8T0X3F3_PANVG|nr:hypothetical protein PVAP13_1NG451619 [Panicum virgatum]
MECLTGHFAFWRSAATNAAFRTITPQTTSNLVWGPLGSNVSSLSFLFFVQEPTVMRKKTRCWLASIWESCARSMS